MGALYRRFRLGQVQTPKEEADQGVSSLTAEAIEEMTKNEIMAELKRREIDFDQRENKEALKGLLLNAIE